MAMVRKPWELGVQYGGFLLALQILILTDQSDLSKPSDPTGQMFEDKVI